MMAMQAGIPALWITHDSRTRELTQALHLPACTYREVLEAKKFSDLMAHWDPADFYAAYPGLYRNYLTFLTENGLKRPPSVHNSFK